MTNPLACFRLFTILFQFLLVSIPLLSQTCLPGGITFSNQAQINSFPDNYPGCTEIQGNVILGFSGSIDSLTGLSQLTKIDGNLIIEAGNDFVDLQGLENLSEIGGYFYANNTNLVNMQGLESLQKVGSYFFLANNTQLTDMTALSQLDTVMGYLDIVGNSKLISLQGIQGISFIGDKVRIQDNDRLKDMQDFPALTKINTELIIYGNDSLLSLNGMENLETIDGHLNLSYNNQLQDLTGLRNLSSINGFLTISWNPVLTNLCGLENISGMTSIFVTNNIQLSQCELLNICAFTSTAGPGMTSFSGNKSGCLSEAEVLTACMSGNNPCCDLTIDSIVTLILPHCQTSDGQIAVYASCSSCTGLEYSIDGQNWQEQGVINNLAAGLHEITIRNGTNFDCTNSILYELFSILDTIAPVVLGKSNEFYFDSNGIIIVDANMVDDGTFDECGGVEISVSPDTFRCIPQVYLSGSILCKLTADNEFYLFLSKDPFNEGELVGFDSNWPSVTNYLVELEYGQVYYLHIKARDYGGPEMFIGDFYLTGDFIFSNGQQQISTNTNDWTVSSTGYNQDSENPIYLGNNGTGIWGARSSLSGNAQYIWHSSRSDNVFFSIPILPMASKARVELKAKDLSGNMTVDSFDIFLRDSFAPIAKCLDSLNVFVEIDGKTEITPDLIDNGSYDACGQINLLLDKSEFTVEDVGVEKIKLKVSDFSGNSSYCECVISVFDTISPMVECRDLFLEFSTDDLAIISSSPQPKNIFDLRKLPAAYNSETVRLKDLDMDGDLDAVILYTNLVELYSNDGSSQFTKKSTLPFGNCRDIVLYDFDKDNDIDIFLISAQGLYIIRNFGSMDFEGQLMLNRSDLKWINYGDFDRDGYSDILLSTLYAEILLKNLGDGNYVYNSQILDSYSASKTIVGDLDNDADLDIIRGSSVFLNNGEAIFTPGDRIDYSFTGKAIGLGDINGDDFLDLVVANITNPNTNSKSFMVLTNDKTGKFTFLNFFGNSVISEFALIDLDGDEDLDIVSAVINNFESDQKYNSTWINDGEGAFSEQSRFGNAQSYGLDFGDLDNDGDLDFFFANRFNNEFGDFSHCIYFVKNPTSILKSIEDNDELQNIQISLSQDTFSLADLGENFVTVTATDASGNSSSCVAKVTVSDCGCFPSSSPLIPNSVSGMHVADCKTVDGAFTHYCDSQGRLLLSLDSETAATVSPEDVSIKIAQGGFYYNKFCTNVSGTHTGDCFISNDDGSVVLCRTWDVNSPATNARVRYYFSQSDIDIVNQENYNRGLTPITDPSQFWFYKVLNGEGHAKPEDLALSDVKIIDNDGTGLVSTNNWRLGNVPGGYFAEYAVNSFSGGGGGIAEKGSSPVCPVIEASIRGDGLPDSLGLSSVVFVDILGGNSPYRVILGNGTTVEQYHSGDSIIVFSNFASGDLSILSVVDSLGCPHSTLSGSVPQFFPLGDSISPVALCKDTILTLDQFNMAHLSAKELDAGSTDNDFIVTYSLTRSTFSCADFGDLQVEMSVFDQSGNSASCFSNITISDPLNACCPNLRLLEQIPATTKSYSGQMIHSNAEVKLGVGLTDIRFLAQESILLLDNFEVKEGAVFSAEIYPCDLNLIKQKVRKID